MALRHYLEPLAERWWLLAMSVILAVTSATLVTRDMPPLFRARATLLVGQTIFEPNPTGNEFFLGQQLATAYANIAEREPVRKATMDALGLEDLPRFDARPLPNSQMIEIVVADSDPERAAAVANDLALQLISQSPSREQQDEQDRQEFLSGQLDDLEAKIKATQQEIQAQREAIAEMVSAADIAAAGDTILGLETRLTTLQTNYATLTGASGAGAINTLTLIEPAHAPTKPVGLGRIHVIIIAGISALVLASGAAYLLESLDDTIRDPDDVARITHLPVIGHIPNSKALRINGADPQLFAKIPNSQMAEAFRGLRTNLEFAGVQSAPRTILIASPSDSQDAITVAAQLGASFALAGKRVALVDANLREPSLHKFLDIENKLGLSDMLADGLVPQVVAQESSHWRMNYITAGNPKENAEELLGSVWLLKVIIRLREQADVAIFLGPSFRVAESFILASKLEATLIVMRPGSTREGVATTIMEQLERSQANVLGVVMNGLRSRKKPAIFGYIYSRLNRTNGADGQPKPAQGNGGSIELPRPETEKEQSALEAD